MLARRSGSAMSQDILSQMERLDGKRKPRENFIGGGRSASHTCGFSKVSLYKKHKRESEILVLAPLCQTMLHKPQ